MSFKKIKPALTSFDSFQTVSDRNKGLHELLFENFSPFNYLTITLECFKFIYDAMLQTWKEENEALSTWTSIESRWGK